MGGNMSADRDTALSEHELRHRYAALRAVGQGPLAVLQISRNVMQVAVGDGSAAPTVVTVGIASHRLAHDHFRHQPPREAELEEAIMVVEDAIAPLRPLFAADPICYCPDPMLREIAELAGVTGQARLTVSREAVEHLFGRLADAAQRRVLAGLPASADFAAGLLIVRELMHHMGLVAISTCE
jgi:exopolyphosphatase/pppGpp-phosphohydrolase